MNISVYSRDEIEEIIQSGQFPDNTAVISYYDPAIKKIDKDYTHVDYSGVCDDVFFCELDDLDIDDIDDLSAFFPEVDRMAEFIYSVYNNGMDIICQCEYGQSRSAGTASAISEHFYHNGIWIFADYKRYPSRVVFNKVFQALENYKKIISESY